RWTGTAAPVTGADSAPARNRTVRATCSGGVHNDRSASGWARRLAGVSIVPGRTVLQRTFASAYSTATARANASTAALAVAYAAAPRNGWTAARAETHTTAPPPAATRWGRQAAVTSQVGRRLRRS